MNMLLIFFAIPLAVIILSAILETFINCPLKVAGIFFSIFIVVAFALGGTAELIVLAIVYTIISFITALIIKLFMNRRCNTNNIINNCELNRICSNTPFNFNNNSEINPLLEDTNSFNTINSNSIINSNDFSTLNNSTTHCRRCRN